jgi:integrase
MGEAQPALSKGFAKMPAYAGTPYKDATTGVLIYQDPRSKKGTFYFRFPLPGGGKWFEGNTKVTGPITNPCVPPSDAIAVAVAEWKRVQAQIQSGSTATKAKSIKSAAQEYLDELEAGFKNGKVSKDRLKNRGGFVRNYIFTFKPFDKMTINAFDEVALEAFSLHCLGDKKVAYSTADKWGIYLGEVFKKAVALKWLPKSELPTTKLIIPPEQVKNPEQTPRFTEDEWEKMKQALPTYLNGPYLSDYDKKLRRLVVLMSEVCYAYGLRSGEAIRLQWDCVRLHAEEDRSFYVLDVNHALKGHAEHIRTSIPLEWWEPRVKEIFEKELPRYFSDCGLETKGLLFQRPNGGEPDNIANVFDKWLEAAEIKNNFGKHSMTSFRHTWINEMIERTTLSDGTIADLVGTSAKMLKDTYRKAFAIRQIENQRRQQKLIKMLEEQHQANKAKEAKKEPDYPASDLPTYRPVIDLED